MHPIDAAGDSLRVADCRPGRPGAIYCRQRLNHRARRLADGQRSERPARRDLLFNLNLIPHTGEVTTLGTLKAGDAVNLEIDVLARYLMRMQSLRG